MKKLAAFLGFLLLVALVIMPACKTQDDVITRSQQLGSTYLSELSLAMIWQAAIECSDIEEPTARLESFRLTVNPDKEISSLVLNFEGTDIGGYPKFCFTSLAQDGKLIGNSYSNKNAGSFERRPMEVFRELDKVGLEKMAEMEMGDGGFCLEISFYNGSLNYNSIYTTIYEMRDGLLVPLKEITFNNQPSVAVIALGQISPDSNSTVTLPQTEELRTSQLWFLPADVAKAGSVECLKTSMQNYWVLSLGLENTDIWMQIPNMRMMMREN